MHVKWRLALTTLVLLAALALIGAVEFLPHTNAGRPANPGIGSPPAAKVVISWFKFQPATVTVHVGETVEWKNDEIVPHTVTANGEKPAFDSGSINP